MIRTKLGVISLKKEIPRITIILRGYNFEQLDTVSEIISKSKYDYAVEITLNTQSAFNDLTKIKEKYKDLVIGAGTVLNVDQVKEAIEAGAEFILSPMKFSNEMIEFCNKNNILSVPAGLTPSEIKELFNNGADIVKVFPATTVGPKFFKDIQAPFGELPLMAVGGINNKNAVEFIENGASYLGIGSGIFDEEDIISKDIDKLEKSLRKFEESVYSKIS